MPAARAHLDVEDVADERLEVEGVRVPRLLRQPDPPATAPLLVTVPDEHLEHVAGHHAREPDQTCHSDVQRDVIAIHATYRLECSHDTPCYGL